MSAADDLVAERFGKSLWWDSARRPAPPQTDDELTTARRRGDASREAYDHDQREERAS